MHENGVCTFARSACRVSKLGPSEGMGYGWILSVPVNLLPIQVNYVRASLATKGLTLHKYRYVQLSVVFVRICMQ